MIRLLTTVADAEFRHGLPAKAFGVLAYLIHGPATAVRRSDLALVFWPGNLPAARHSLSQALYTIRKSPFGEYLSTSNVTVSIEGLESDAVLFDSLIADRKWIDAATLFRAEFCDGLELRSDPFDEWVLRTRRRYNDKALTVAKGLVRGFDRDDASRILRIIGEDFRAEMSAAPMLNSSVRVVGLGLPGEFESKQDVAARPRFVGRDEEIESFLAAWRLTQDGLLTVNTITGEPGIGKSALLERLRKIVALDGGGSHYARAFDAERNVPWGVAAQWVRSLRLDHADIGSPWAAILRDAFPAIDDPREPPRHESDLRRGRGQLEILEALANMLLSASGTRPLLLCVDDYTFADPASSALINFLTHRLAQARISIVLTARSEILGPSIAEAKAGAAIELGPLSRDDLRQLLEGLRGTKLEESDLEDIARRTGGNPLLALVSFDKGQDAAHLDSLPLRVTGRFQPWLEGISADSLLVLAVLGLISPPVDSSLIQSITEFPTGRFAHSVRELSKRGLLVDSHTGFEPRHGLMAEAALDILGAPAQRTLRGRVARVLESTGESPPALVAPHFDIAGQRAYAFKAAIKAAEAAEQLAAFAEAEYFLAMAMANAANSEYRIEIGIRLCKLLARGKPQRAMEVLSSLKSGALDVELEARVDSCELMVRAAAGDPEWLVSRGWDRLQELQPHLTQEEYLESSLALAVAANKQGWSTVGEHARSAAAALVDSIADFELEIRSRLAITVLEGYYGDLESALQTIKALSNRVSEHPHLHLAALAMRGALLVSRGAFSEAEQHLLEAIELVERFGLADNRLPLLNNLGVCYTERGKWIEAERLFDEGISYAMATGREGDLQLLQDNRLTLLLATGDYAEVLAYTQGILSTDVDHLSRRSVTSVLGLGGLAALELGKLTIARDAYRRLLVSIPEPIRWSNDISHSEIFISRMRRLDNDRGGALDRLNYAIDLWDNRDLCCFARLELERLEWIMLEDPYKALRTIEHLEDRLRTAGAAPLVERCERLRSRIERSVG